MGVCMSIDEQSTLQKAAYGTTKPLKGKKKIVMEMLNPEAKVAEMSTMPSGICANGTTVSACAFSKQGSKGVNQDCMFVWEEFAAQGDTVFCGVFDGHGPNGHLVAKKVRDNLPVLLALPHNLLLNEVNNLDGAKDAFIDDECQKEENSVLKSQEQTAAIDIKSSCDLSRDHEPVMKASCDHKWREKLFAAYKIMDMNLKSHRKLHCFDSGTTAVTMVLQGKDLYIGNVGDSRAILARRSHENGSLVAHQVTTDLKPNLPKELERIKRYKGRVFALEDEPDVARVWLPHLDMPGLAMARALGDFCLKEYGLSATPQIFARRLVEEDEFVVLASDGIWDVLSNEDVVRIVASAVPKETAAKALVHAAVRSWKIKHGVWRTDDCTAVCYFMREKLVPTFSTRIDH